MSKSRKFMLIPLVPSREVLQAMASATQLKDGSDLEMARRYNAMLEAVASSRKKKKD